MQKRDEKSKKATPFTESDLEKYTYFYIDFKSNRMAIMQNKGLSKIGEIMRNFLLQRTDDLSDISFFPEKIRDFYQYAKQISKFKNIEFTLIGSDKDIVPCVKESLDDTTVKSYKINITLSEVSENIIDKIFNFKKNKSNNVTAMRAYGKNEFGLDDVIDFFETQFTKTIPIEINEKNVLDTDYIKEKLSFALFNITN